MTACRTGSNVRLVLMISQSIGPKLNLPHWGGRADSGSKYHTKSILVESKQTKDSLIHSILNVNLLYLCSMGHSSFLDQCECLTQPSTYPLVSTLRRHTSETFSARLSRLLYPSTCVSSRSARSVLLHTCHGVYVKRDGKIFEHTSEAIAAFAELNCNLDRILGLISLHGS